MVQVTERRVTDVSIGRNWHGGTIRMARGASRRKDKISAICSSKSRKRSQFTLTKALVLVETAATSWATPSWFKRETAPRHLWSRSTQGSGAAGLFDYQTGWFPCSHGALSYRTSRMHQAYRLARVWPTSNLVREGFLGFAGPVVRGFYPLTSALRRRTSRRSRA